MLKEEWTPSELDIPQLASRAQEAYEQKRTKECVALTKTLVQADPENPIARSLQSSIQADMQRDLNDARALLEDFRNVDGERKFRKAAEIILLKILHLDPEHEQAKTLLSTARAMSEIRPRAEVIPFTAGYRKSRPKNAEKPMFTIPMVLVAIVVLVCVLLGIRQSFIANQNPGTGLVAPLQPVGRPIPVASSAVQRRVTAPAIPVADANTPAVPADPVQKTTGAIANALSATGTLAVSSPAAADIYVGDKFLGSTPATLQLPVGRQTLEYRHGDLRTVASYDIHQNEMTTARISFDVVVQINARPWAQVFLEGTTRQPLGQTPLSGIHVPIGSVLVFENSNFPSKTHRVAERDTAIQIVFP